MSHSQANPRKAPFSAATLAAVIVVTSGALSIIGTRAAAQERVSQTPSEASLNIVMDFLSNTAPDKVEAAANRLVAQDATYVSLNFSNPELKKIMPWTGTDKGPRAYSDTFLRVANYWTIEDFTVTDKFASGEDVAVFGRFTYRSVATGHAITSPFSIHAKVHDDKIVYFQFMEDTYATASSFRQTGSWVVKTTIAAKPVEVGTEQLAILPSGGH